MTPVPAGHPIPTQPSGYDTIADGYTTENETGLPHAYYNRPAILELAGDVAGRRILDVGCGSGPLFAALRDRGATLTGIDNSARMLEHAQRLAGDTTDYFQTRNRIDEWTMGGQTARLSFWDRPLHAMTDAFTAAGFRISVISEPPPCPPPAT